MTGISAGADGVEGAGLALFGEEVGERLLGG